MRLFRLLDVSGMFWRIWRVKEGANKPIGEAAAETVQALREHAARGGADFVVACCDAPGRNFRHDVAEEYRTLVPDYKGYKGHRAEKDPAMMAALDRVIDELEQDGVPIVRVPGFEADDVIATITGWATANGDSVEVVSEDKDLLALARDVDPDSDTAPSVTVIRRDGKRQGYDACVERLGVPPELVAAMLAMAGDTSDGILGIPGIGKKTAAALLWGEWVGKEWQPTPFRRFGAMVDAAVQEQALVEMIEREKLRRRVEAGMKKNASDATIAERLKIAVEDVERYRAMQAQDIPADHKPRFAADVRRSLIANAESYDIGVRLAELRRDVPLDFAAVTAPRVPKRDPAKEAERAELLKRAHEEAQADEAAAVAAAQEEQQTMTQTIDAEYTDPKPEPVAAVAPQPTTPAPVATPTPLTVQTPQNGNGAAKPAQTAALARVGDRAFEQQLEARNLTEAQWLAKSIAASRKIKDAGDENAVLLKLTVGRSLGMTLYQCLRMYLMEGQVAMRTQQVLARVKSSPLCEYIRLVHLDDKSCTWETKRRGEPKQQRTFTIEQAHRAMLGGIEKPGETFKPASAWAKWTEDMLSARAVMPLMRQEYPEIADGYSVEELGDDPRAGSIDTTGEAA